MHEEDFPTGLVEIGVVHSTIVDRRLMPLHGVRALIEIFPEYADGLRAIEENSHIWIIAWLRNAERERVEIVRPEYEASRRRRGVFGLRSTTRPNSIGMSVCKIVSVHDRQIELDNLDFIDGTPIIDVKRYSPSWDCIFAARSSRDLFHDISDISTTDELEHAASMFHGNFTPAIAAGARLMQFVIRSWSLRPKEDNLTVTVPPEPEFGEITDAIQGITAATLGNGRLKVRDGGIFEFECGERYLSATPRDLTHLSLTEIRIESIEHLFVVSGN